MKTVAYSQGVTWARAVFLSALVVLGGCALPLPDKPARPALYDLGGLGPPLAAAAARRAQPLALHAVAGAPAVDSTAMLYRLRYAEGGGAQQPRAYAQARWSMPPPQLVDERLRQALAAARAVAPPGAGLAAVQLDAELQEFVQDFSAPGASEGVVQLRATLTAPAAAAGQRLLGQRSFTARVPTPSPDAPGGAQALRQATDEVVQQVVQWVDGLTQAAGR